MDEGELFCESDVVMSHDESMDVMMSHGVGNTWRITTKAPSCGMLCEQWLGQPGAEQGVAAYMR
jgi:hypothetical protein